MDVLMIPISDEGTEAQCLFTQLVSGKVVFELLLKRGEYSSGRREMHAKHLQMRREGEIKQNYAHISCITGEEFWLLVMNEINSLKNVEFKALCRG